MDKINGISDEVKHSIIPTEIIMRNTTAPAK
jgi:hypothetical protein